MPLPITTVKTSRANLDPGSAPGSPSLGRSGSSVSGGTLQLHGFTAETCLKLLEAGALDDSLIEAEYKSMRARFPNILPTSRNTDCIKSKRSYLRRGLLETLREGQDYIVNNYDTLVTTLSSVITKLVDACDVTADAARCATRDAASAAAAVQRQGCGDLLHDAGNPPPPPLEAPVSKCELNLNQFEVGQFLDLCDFSDHNGNRSVAYYGTLPYTYGRFKHEPAPYPEGPVFDSIFASLRTIDPDISKESYSCLVTYYENGNSMIPLHHDDEPCIVEDSTIYTVCLGATRVLKVSNISGPFQELHIPLEHGDVYSMTRASQNIWRHGIDREPLVKDPRISLTLRKMRTPPADEKQQIPPIAKPSTRRLPERPQPTTDDLPAPPRTERILLLADSLYNRTPQHVLNTIPSHMVVCRPHYRLTEIFGFEPDFKNNSMVVLSCGINDLSRYNETAESLASKVCDRLARSCELNPRTKFIFNSLTLTADQGWLNSELTSFNNTMFELSLNVPNLYYFDSHGLISREFRRSRRDDVYEIGGNGIHLSLAVRKLVSRELMSALGALCGARGDRFRPSEWLHNAASGRQPSCGRGGRRFNYN